MLALAVRKPVTVQNLEKADSELNNVLLNTKSTPIKTEATTSKTTPKISRTNRCIIRPGFEKNKIFVARWIEIKVQGD